MNTVKLWKIIVAFLLVFAAGVFTGVVGTKIQGLLWWQRSLHYENWVNSTMQELDSKLKLTPQQRPKIQALVERTVKQVRDNLVQMTTNSLDLIERSGDEIDKELTPEQRTIHAGIRERFRKGIRDGLHWDLERQSTNAPTLVTPGR